MWRRCWGCFGNPFWKRAFWLEGRDGSWSCVAGGRMRCGSAPWHISGNAGLVNLNLLQTSLTEESRVINPSVAMPEKRADSPLRRGAIMSCAATAIYKMNGCQQPSWSVPRYAFQPCQETAEGPFWGGLSVSFQRSIPPFGPETSFGIWSGWDSPGLVTLSVGGRCRRPAPSCAISEWISRLT